MDIADNVREASIKNSVAERNEEKKKKLLLSDKLEATQERQIATRQAFGKYNCFNEYLRFAEDKSRKLTEDNEPPL